MKAINRHLHWPVSPDRCSCGDRFESPEQHLAHARAFIGKWHSGPAWTTIRGPRRTIKLAFVAPGHTLTFQPGVGLHQRMNKVKCSCNFEQYTTSPAGPIGKQHVREVIEKIIFTGVQRGARN